MFGYVRPVKSELKVKDYELFKAAYCGLCMALKNKYGFAARFAVNYDLSFLAMLLAENGCQFEKCARRCPASPCVKKQYLSGDDVFEAAADLSVILSWWKLKDEASEGKHRVTFSLLCALLKRKYNKAASAQRYFADNAEKYLAELSACERASSDSLDEAADKFAKILEAASALAEDETERRILSQILYHIGRFVYILDALDDFEKDSVSGNYNPLRFRFGNFGSALSDEEKQLIGETLAASEAMIASAYELKNKNQFDDILSNIIYNGLPAVRKLVDEGRGGELKRLVSIHTKEKMRNN